MMNWYGNTGGQSWIWMSLMMLGGLVFLGVAAWAIMRSTRSDRLQSGAVGSPRTILDRRFANGEITADQYAEARRALDGDQSQAPVPPMPTAPRSS